MDFKEKMKNFNRRWNITTSDSPEEAFNKFKKRVLTAFQHVEDQLTSKSVTRFCQYYAIEEKWANIASTRLSENIINHLKQQNTIPKLCEAIELILSLGFKDYQDYQTSIRYNYRSETIQAIKESIELSDVNIALKKQTNGGVILCPKGEEKLDEELVNKTLSFLNENSNKHFEDALKFYQNKNPIKSAESLRRTLEEFLRYKLKNNTGLKDNITNLQKKLKNNGKSELRNVIFQTFNYLDKYFNEHSKHNDSNIKEPENDFLIYQIGLLMRYINQIT